MIFKAGPGDFFTNCSGSALWYLAPCYRTRIWFQKEGSSRWSRLPLGIGHIMPEFSVFEWGLCVTLLPEQSGQKDLLNIFLNFISKCFTCCHRYERRASDTSVLYSFPSSGAVSLEAGGEASPPRGRRTS